MTAWLRTGMIRFGLALLLSACTAHGDPTQPVPTAFIPARQPATRAFVVLPGRADDLEGLRRSGAAQAIQSVWPDTDVVLAEVTIEYYLRRDVEQRLHDVIAPLRARGYREVWLGGASLGGLGSLAYEMRYPQDIDGLVLLAPYLGERSVIEEIEAQGGIATWRSPPPSPQPDRQEWQRDVWRRVQAWSHDARRTRNVWLAYGDQDPLRMAQPLLAPLLPPGHVRTVSGGHSWAVWTPALHDILATQSAATAAAGTVGPSRSAHDTD